MDSYNPDMEIDSIETQPPPRPAPSRRNTDKPPKLRSSCDICASAYDFLLLRNDYWDLIDS